ncbi:hypothetical protein KJ359_003987 [Pestalotiopsis sp. 9143b]|nr:hypothetical protein KJ359_003987 [Pestalotiopsis sp. 9143b]
MDCDSSTTLKAGDLSAAYESVRRAVNIMSIGDDQDIVALNDHVSTPQPTVCVISDIEANTRTVHPTNHRLIAPYPEEYWKSGGEATLKGVRTNFRLTTAQYGYGDLRFDMMHDETDTSTKLKAFASWSTSPLHVSNPKLSSMTGEEFRGWSQRNGLHQGRDDLYGDVQWLRFTADSRRFMYVSHPSTILDHDKIHTECAAEAHDNTKSRCTNLPAKKITIDLFFPTWVNVDELYENLRATMTNAQADPYEKLYPKSSDRHFSTDNAMAAIADIHAKQPEAAVYSYTGGIKELQVRNAYGLRDEFIYSEGLMALMERKSCLAIFVEIPGHKIRGFQASWFVIFRRHDETMIPGIGEHFHIRMPNVPFTQPDVPCNISKREKIHSITQHIVYVAGIALDAYRNDEIMARSLMLVALDDITRKAATPGDEAQCQRWKVAHAVNITQRLRAIPEKEGLPAIQSETNSEYYDRILEWVKTNYELIKLPTKHLDHCPDLKAVRHPVPAFLQPLGSFGAFVFAPAIPDFPKDGAPAPVIDVQVKPFPPNALSNDMSKTMEHHLNDTQECFIVREEHHGPLTAGLKAMRTFCDDIGESSGAPFDVLARFVARGKGDVITHDLARGFGGFDDFMRHVDNGTTPTHSIRKKLLTQYHLLDEDQKRLFQYVKEKPFGLAVIAGGHKAGKNHTVLLLIMVILSGRLDTSEFHKWTKVHLDITKNWDWDEGGELPKFRVYEPEGFEHLLRPKYLSKPMEMRDVDTGSNTSRKLASLGPVLITAPSNKVLDEHAEDVNDMTRKLGIARIIVRAQMPGAAVREAMRQLETAAGRTRNEEIGVDTDISPEVKAGLGELRRLCLAVRQKSPPGGRFSTAKYMVDRILDYAKGDILAQEAWSLLSRKRHDPSCFYDEDSEELKALWTALKNVYDDVLKKAHFIIATSEVAMRIADKRLDIEPSILWGDDTFRTPEHETIIGLTVAPKAGLRIFTGDKECRPRSKAANAHMAKDPEKNFCSVFGEQYQTSTAERLCQTGYPVHYLTKKHRA